MPSPLVSVVIPVYNAMPYLIDCLDSVCKQTLENIEIICVDDGSTDDSHKTIEAYAEKDGRIKLLQGDPENSNGGAARNLGLKQASGEYVIFLDADDFFELDMLEKTYENAKKNDSDVVIFNGNKYDQKTGEFLSTFEALKTKVMPDQESFSAEDIKDRIFQITSPNPWTKLYRRQFLIDKSIVFQSLPNSNDMYMTFAALSSAARIFILNESFAHYRVNTHSSTQDGKWRDPFCFLEALSNLEKRLETTGDYETFKSSFIEAALNHSKYNITSQKNYEARLQIMDAIESGKYLDTDLLVGNDDILSKRAKSLRAFLRSALDQKRYIQFRNDPADLKVKRYLSNGNDGEVAPLLSIVVANASQSFIDALPEKIDQADFSCETIAVSCESEKADLSRMLNLGIDSSNGKYLYILEQSQSEKGLNFNALAKNLIALADSEKNNDQIDVLWIHDNQRSMNSENSDSHFPAPFSEKTQTGKELICHLYSTGEYDCNLRNYVFRRDAAKDNNIEFNPDINCNDIEFTFKLLACSDRCRVSRIDVFESDEDESPIKAGSSFNDCFGISYSSDACLAFLRHTQESWKPNELDVALKIIGDASNKAIEMYSDLPQNERGRRLALSPIDEFAFRRNVIIPSLEKRYKEKYENEQKKTKDLASKKSKEASGGATKPHPSKKRLMKRLFG